MKKVLIASSDTTFLDDIIWALRHLPDCKKIVIHNHFDVPQLTTQEICDLAIIHMDSESIGLGLGAVTFLQQKGIPVISITAQHNSFIAEAGVQLNLPFSRMSLFEEVESMLAKSQPKLNPQIEIKPGRRYHRCRR